MVGDLSKAFMRGITMDSLVETLPEALWALYQMTFAVITPALMIGAFVERMKFNASILYMALWSVAVYYPACHLIWGGGALGAAGVIDFAGGLVVHLTAGAGALVAAYMVGPRKNTAMVPGNSSSRSSARACSGWAGSASTGAPPRPRARAPPSPTS